MRDVVTVSDMFRVADKAAAATPKRGRRRPSPVETLRVHAEVWEHALDLAGGDVRRLLVEHASSVVVLNHPTPMRRAQS